MDGEIVGTFTTDENGVIYLPEAENGWYTVTERKAAEGYRLDDTPHRVEVREGQTATLEITNKAISGILLHKVNAVTGEDIPGVSFLLYDSGNNPIAQETSDDRGYVGLRDWKMAATICVNWRMRAISPTRRKRPCM